MREHYILHLLRNFISSCYVHAEDPSGHIVIRLGGKSEKMSPSPPQKGRESGWITTYLSVFFIFPPSMTHK